MIRRYRDDRGQVIVLGAVMIPVFLLIAALVIDVGNWYTHKRQLQNRADAAAFAAGVEYGKNWQGCLNSDPTIRDATASMIANVARQYAGDPEAADYAPGTTPSLYNTQITNQSKLDVMINAADYTNNTDYTDGGATNVADPCFKHDADALSAAGYWTDVKVKERDLPSLFGSIGLPLSRNGARARIEIRPALSGKGFLPLAIPDNVIDKVQVRYYNGCTGNEILSARKDLAPLPSDDQTAYAGLGGGTLWGLPAVDGDLSVGDSNRAFDLDVPRYEPTQCSTPYLPVKVEVRIASRDEIDLNAPCGSLASSKFADCFSNVSQIRVWPDGNPNTHPLIKDVHLTGGCAPRADAYFGPYDGVQARGSRTCSYGATVDVDFGGRAGTARNFKVKVNGVDLNPPSASNPTGVWTTAGTPLSASTYLNAGVEKGDNPVTVKVEWTPPSGGPQSYGELAQQVYVGTVETAGAIDLVRTSQTAFSGPAGSRLPGPALDNVTDGGTSVAVFPTIGIRGLLRTGVLTTLRLDDPQANQTLRCDPDYTNGQVFSAFRFGCKPFYGRNTFKTDDDNAPWWIPTTTPPHCPKTSDFFSYATMPPPYGKNTMNNYWRCVPTAPGLRPPTIGEGMSAATDNCDRYTGGGGDNANQCQQTRCNVQGNYDGIPGNPDGWVTTGSSEDPRVVNLFVIPYQALKGSSGSDPEETVPILRGAAFYVMNWTGQNANNSDPCPDRTFGAITVPDPPPGSAIGVFVSTVKFTSGPVDPNATCTLDMLDPCRPVLVR